jgi:signal transduction histidine kinase/CheY-like chemotaxis protein
MSIRKRLLLIVLLAMLPPTLLVAVRFFQDYHHEIAHAATDLTLAANTLAQNLDEKIQGTSQLLYGLARARDLDTTDRAACSTFLSDVLQEYPLYTGILTIRPDGTLFCDSLNSGRELDLRDRRYYQEALGRVSGVALEPAFGRLTGTAVVQIAFPVRAPDGKLQHILLASLDLNKFLNGNAQKALLSGARIALVDRRGTLLTVYPGNETSKGRIGSDLNGTDLFRFAQRHPMGGVGELAGIGDGPQVWASVVTTGERDPGLFILAGRSKAELVAEANERLTQGALLLFVLSLFLVGGAWLVAEHAIRRPVKRIAHAVSQLGQGDLATRLTAPIPRGELGELMEAVNVAAQSLETQRSDIETLHDHLRQSQKMEAVGHLTGGIAHDFNNLMTVILGNSEMLSEELEDNPRLKNLADTSLAASERAADLTRSLLAFARKQPLNPRSVNLNDLLLRMKSLLERSLGETIECIFLPGAETWPAMVDATQMESAVLNLAINARDAMPHGGRLTIESANATLDADYCRSHAGATPGDYVMICVSDTGTGMTEEVMEKAFDPFFTTKEVGQGSGLGLSMIYGFLKQSNGYVVLYSELGLGTSVKLYLPRADAALQSAGVAAEEIVRGQGQTILIVEDNDIVRHHVVGLAEELGYRIVTARDGAEALVILKGPAPIDLLFTDIVMPGGMSGIDLAREATALRPGLKVLYTSGYTENTIVHDGQLGAGSQFLNKPYRRLELAAKIYRALNPV